MPESTQKRPAPRRVYCMLPQVSICLHKVQFRDDSGGRPIDRKNQENPENSPKIAKNRLNLTNFVLFEASKNRKS